MRYDSKIKATHQEFGTGVVVAIESMYVTVEFKRGNRVRLPTSDIAVGKLMIEQDKKAWFEELHQEILDV